MEVEKLGMYTQGDSKTFHCVLHLIAILYCAKNNVCIPTLF